MPDLIRLVKITAQISQVVGGYFFVFELQLIAYPRPKNVAQRLRTAIRSAIVIICMMLLSKDSFSGFYVNGAINSPEKANRLPL